jgi:peptidoglycan-N-acetylglucosamine deacetylase
MFARTCGLVVAALVGVLVVPPAPGAAQLPPPTTCRAHAALTFDDGPHDRFTEQILEILEHRRLRATFFVVGARAAASPAVVQKTRDAGHQVFSHSYSHPRLGDDIEPRGLDYAGTKSEIRRGHEALERALEAPVVKRWRSPGLRYRRSRVVQRASADLGFVHVGGTTTKDWDSNVSDAQVLRNIRAALDTTKDGTILVLHDGVSNSRRTVRILPTIADEIHARQMCAAGIGPDGTVLARPHRPTVTLSRSSGGVRLAWSAAGPRSATPAAYRVFRSTTTTRPRSHLAHTRHLTYTDTSVKRGTTYYYWVQGRNEAGRTFSLRYRIAF